MTRGRRLSFVTLAVLALGACSNYVSCSGPAEQTPETFAVAQPVAPGTAPEGRSTVIAFLGDSITAGLGLSASDAYPNRIQELFAAEGYGEVEALNGGISGDTTAGGLRRVDQFLEPSTKILVVALGGNDALRGLTVEQTHDNLAAIIRRAEESRVPVLLAGMLAPTNLGEDYQAGFRDIFVKLSREHSVAFVPFLLEGVIGNPAMVQQDGVHPTAEGARVIANMLYPKLRDMVDQMSNTRR